MTSDDVSSSTERMRLLQYNDKVSALNRDFIRQLQAWFEQCSHYDFSESVKSYLDHIQKLDKMYGAGGNSSTVDSSTKSAPTPAAPTAAPERKIAKAKRRTNGASNGDKSNELNSSVTVSTPARDPPRFSLGNVSAITVDTPKAVDLTPKVSDPAPSSAAPRKRAIRGGGPLGGPETVVFRDSASSSSASAPSIPIPTISLPKPTVDFWSKKSDAPPKFSFGNSTVSEKKSDEEEKTPAPTTPTITVTKVDDDKEKKDSTEPSKPALSFPVFGGFGSTTTAAKDEANGAKKATLSFPSFGSSSSTTVGSAPATNLFGSLTGGATPFSFGSKPADASATTNAEGGAEDGDDEKYEPPKTEAVQNEETNATLTAKCSVFKTVDKEYKKLGVGSFYLKDDDGKKSVLIRAATATGTVWLNALQGPSMKVTKADEKGEKIRLVCPTSATEMSAFLIRFADVATATKVREEIEASAK